MISMSTLFVIGGAGITLGFIDNILKAMGKEEIGTIITTLALIGLGLYTISIIEQLFTAMKVFL
jgi:stage III sporulation protein AC